MAAHLLTANNSVQRFGPNLRLCCWKHEPKSKAGRPSSGRTTLAQPEEFLLAVLPFQLKEKASIKIYYLECLNYGNKRDLPSRGKIRILCERNFSRCERVRGAACRIVGKEIYIDHLTISSDAAINCFHWRG